MTGEGRRGLQLGVAAACAAGFATGWNISNVGAVAPSLATDYGVSLAAIGLFTATFYLAHSTLQLPAGKASDRFGARAVTLTGLAIVAAFNAVAMLAREPGLAIAARGVIGVGTALGFVGALNYIRAVGGSPVAQGVFGGIGVSAGAVALGVVPQVDRLVGWRAPFLTASLVAVGGLLAVSTGTRLPAGHVLAKASKGTPIARLIADRRLQRVSLVYAGSLGLSIVASNWIVSLLVRQGGVSHAVAGPVAGLSLVAGILTRPLGGWILQRSTVWCRRGIGVSIATGGAGTLALAAARPLPLAILGSVLIGLSAGFPFAPALNAAVRARPDAPGAAIGFVNMSGALTVLVGVPVLGLTFSLPGGGRTGFVAIAVLWVACLLAVPGALVDEPPGGLTPPAGADAPSL